MVKSAFVFPGQGSQSVGMLSDFLPQHPIITQVFEEASEAVGYDLWQLVQNGPVEKLNQTEHTQVVMLTSDIAVFQLLKNKDLPQPQMIAGHSLGEYAALVAAESVSLTDAALLVVERAKAMQNAAPLGQGAMAAIIGLSDEQVKNLCLEASQADQQVTPANFNAIGQVVVAGHTPAVERVIALADATGAMLAKMIPVSVPCHCPLLASAAEEFALSLEKVNFKSPKIDVVSNVDLSIYQTAAEIRTKLQQQLYSPVRWVETVQLFKQNGIELLVECGPGKVLSGLSKRIDKSLKAISVYDSISLDQITDYFNL